MKMMSKYRRKAYALVFLVPDDTSLNGAAKSSCFEVEWQALMVYRVKISHLTKLKGR